MFGSDALACLRLLGSAILAAACAHASVQAPGQAEKRYMDLAGYHDLQGRSAYQPLVHAQGGRWIAYIGLHGGHLSNTLTRATEHNGTAILDVTEPKRPKLLAHIPGAPGSGAQMVRVCKGSELPRADKRSVYLLRSFGTHSSNESFSPVYYKRIMFFAHFNAGVRAVDIRDPTHPKEVGHYIPTATSKTDKRCVRTDAGAERCHGVIQTNNVEVDDRGYVYIVDRARTGMHILELTGPARAIATFQ